MSQGGVRNGVLMQREIQIAVAQEMALGLCHNSRSVEKAETESLFDCLFCLQD